MFSTVTYFSPMFHFYTPLKRQKTRGFFYVFKGVQKWNTEPKWVNMVFLFLPLTSICLLAPFTKSYYQSQKFVGPVSTPYINA